MYSGGDSAGCMAGADAILGFDSLLCAFPMKLLGSVTSPYVRKVRVVMAEKKLDYAFIHEDVWAADTAIAQINPLGKVPCLVMEDGSALYDSRVIVEYMDTLTPVCKLLPPNGRDRAEVKNWEALADGVLDAGVLMRLETTLRPEAQQSPDWIARQRGKVHAGLHTMSERLGESSYCNGVHYSLADVAVGCALGWISFRFPDIEWRGDYPNLVRLFDKLSERQSFKDTAPVTA